MGCSPSKLHADDTVRRCKDRRRFMKEAVYARHHLAAAHSDYCRSLRNTGEALVTFAYGEPLSASDHSPAALRRTPTPADKPAHVTSFPSPSPSIHPPPAPPPLSPTFSTHHQKPPPEPPRRRRKSIKLPHILSDSSLSSSPPPIIPNVGFNATTYSTYSSTPSQASSAWNWDNFYPPPSPPDSDFFHNFEKNEKSETLIDDDDAACGRGSHPQNAPIGKQLNDRASNSSSYSRNSDKSRAKIHPRRNSKNWGSEEEDGEETEREEVQCSEWGDHDDYSSTSSSVDEEDEFNPRSDYRATPNRNKNSSASPNLGTLNPKFSTKPEKLISDDDSTSYVRLRNGNANPDRRIVLRHQNLVEIATSLREHFNKAASAGDQVSEMLESGRAQLDRSFKHLRKTIHHSSGLLSSLSSSLSSKPPLTVKYRLEVGSIEQCNGPKGLCSTLERLLAWEKKLYQEVKARETIKFEHEKKLSVLQSQEYRNEDEAKLTRTKVSIKRLQSLISVTSQAVSTTSFAIVGLRDSDLIPQLVELCHGFMYMWRSMSQFHENQSNVIQQVQGLVTNTAKKVPTTDVHRQATRDLESAVSTWQSSFCRIIKLQRDFIRALYGWFKLSLLPVTSEPSNGSRDLTKVLAFFDEWRLALDRVPDTVASEAIKSFNNIIHSIFVKQTEELKSKKRAEAATKELEKKASSIRTIEKRFYNSYSLVGVGLPDDCPSPGHLLDTRDPLAERKAELALCQRRAEDEMVKHLKAIEVTRAMTLNNLQMGLPGVFHAMTSFSTLITEALETVCTRSYDIE